MPNEIYWIWIERVYNKIPVNRLTLAFIMLFIVLFPLNTILHIKKTNVWNISDTIKIGSACFLVAFEVVGVRYFICNMRKVFENLDHAPGCGENICNLKYQIEKQFKSRIIYIIIVMFLALFYGIDIIREESYFFSSYYDSIWAKLLDIFNFFITILILCSMAIIVWIIFNISWSLNKIEGDKQIIKVDLFHADQVGGLEPIRDLILKLVVFQFISISFGIISFLMPILYFEILFLVSFFLITTYLFIVGWYAIHKLLEGERTRTINAINKLYLRQYLRMEDIISKDDYSDKKEELNLILTSIEFLHDERVQVIHASKRAYNFKALFVFISSSLIPFITTYLLPLIVSAESDGYGQMIQIIELFNPHVLAMINDSIQMIV